jgi:hypothetical protein
MHDGPGLMDRRRPMVRLPVGFKGEVKMRKEVSGGGDVEVSSKVFGKDLFGEEVYLRLPLC